MNNLGVYGGCRLLFDSLEVPAKCMESQNEPDISDTIDLSFARGVLLCEISGETSCYICKPKHIQCGDLIFFVDCVEEIVLEMRVKDEISPTLRTIVNQFDENNKRPTGFQLPGQNSAEELDADFNCENGAAGEEYDNGANWSDDHDDQPVIADLGSNDVDPSFPSYPQVCRVLTI
jgi:condensin complex subunit 2